MSLKELKEKDFGEGGQGPTAPGHPLKTPQHDPPVVALIGGQGQMGRWFQRFFESQGLQVLVADLDTLQTPQEVAALADVVIISVPIPSVKQVVREVGGHLRDGAALMDLTSVKQGPMKAMLASFKGEVVGTHPLFGPGEDSIAGRTSGAYVPRDVDPSKDYATARLDSGSLALK